MTSIALGIVIVFIVYVMIWSIRNDGVRRIGDQTGLIRMRDPDKAARRKDARVGPGRAAAPAAQEPDPTPGTQPTVSRTRGQRVRARRRP